MLDELSAKNQVSAWFFYVCGSLADAVKCAHEYF
jgi:hypothetical protein